MIRGLQPCYKHQLLSKDGAIFQKATLLPAGVDACGIKIVHFHFTYYLLSDQAATEPHILH